MKRLDMTTLQATRTGLTGRDPVRPISLAQLSRERIHLMAPDGSDRTTIITGYHLADGIVVDA